MERPDFIIGIDPDVERSGIAVLDVRSGEFDSVTSRNFFEALECLRRYAQVKSPVVVVIEDSDKSVNWHYNSKDKPGIIAAKGRSVGMCHATTRHLKECAEAMGLTVVMQPPLRKLWSGPDGKITHEEAGAFMRGLPQRTNQEARDAALLAWCAAELPIQVRQKTNTDEKIRNNIIAGISCNAQESR